MLKQVTEEKLATGQMPNQKLLTLMLTVSGGNKLFLDMEMSMPVY